MNQNHQIPAEHPANLQGAAIQSKYTALRKNFFETTDCSAQEKNDIQQKEILILCLTENEFAAARVICGVYDKIQSRVGIGIQNYPAALSLALWIVQIRSIPLIQNALNESIL
jgi:hypothetical protein